MILCHAPVNFFPVCISKTEKKDEFCSCSWVETVMAIYFFYPVVFNCSSLSNVILNIKYTVEQNVLEIILFHSASLKQFLASLFIFKAEGLFSFGGCFFFLRIILHVFLMGYREIICYNAF